MDTPTLIGWIIGALIGAAVGYYIGARKGRPILGLILGFFLNLIGWIIIAIVPKERSTPAS